VVLLWIQHVIAGGHKEKKEKKKKKEKRIEHPLFHISKVHPIIIQ